MREPGQFSGTRKRSRVLAVAPLRFDLRTRANEPREKEMETGERD